MAGKVGYRRAGARVRVLETDRGRCENGATEGPQAQARHRVRRNAARVRDLGAGYAKDWVGPLVQGLRSGEAQASEKCLPVELGQDTSRLSRRPLVWAHLAARPFSDRGTLGFGPPPHTGSMKSSKGESNDAKMATNVGIGSGADASRASAARLRERARRRADCRQRRQRRQRAGGGCTL